jgi:hypothetical protein
MSLWGNIDAANSAPKFLIDSTLVTAANTTNDYSGLAPQVDLRNALYDMTLNGASEDETYAIRKRMMELAGCSEEETSANL